MSTKGGRRTTTGQAVSSWHHSETTTIRIPVEIKEEVLAYARQLDAGHTPNVPLNNSIVEGMALKLFNDFIVERKHKDRIVPLMGWKMFTEFRYWVLERVKSEHKLGA